MSKFCPTCGQQWPDELTVDLNTNTAMRLGRTVELTPTQAEILYVMNMHAPKTTSHLDLDSGLYGAMDAPDNFLEILKKQIWRLRKKISVLGLKIKLLPDEGYQLELIPMPEEVSA